MTSKISGKAERRSCIAESIAEVKDIFTLGRHHEQTAKPMAVNHVIKEIHSPSALTYSPFSGW